MRDYKDFGRSATPTKIALPWLNFTLGTGVIIFCIAAFVYLSYKLDNRQEASGVVTPDTEEFLPQPPPPESEYEFYNILAKEEPVRIERDDDNDVLASSPNVYYVRVPGYKSYDRAISSAKQMISWGVLNQMKVEPYASNQQILFSIRIGPFTSRSRMNEQRDLLYDKDISNEGLGFKK